MNDRLPAAIGSIASIASLLVAILSDDWIGAGVSFFAFLFSGISFFRCGGRAGIFCACGALLALAGVVSIRLALPYDLVLDDSIPLGVWSTLCAILHVIALPPLTIAAFYVIAALFDASFNWALTFSLCPFAGLGILIPGFVMEYFDELLGGAEMPNNAYAVICILAGLLIMAITSIVVRKVMKSNRYLIRRSGREVRQ